MGHDHKRASTSIDRLVLCGARDNLRPKQKTITLVRTGGFLKAYEPGKVSYLTEMAAVPVSLGTSKVTLEWKRKDRDSVQDEYIKTEVTL